MGTFHFGKEAPTETYLETACYLSEEAARQTSLETPMQVSIH